MDAKLVMFKRDGQRKEFSLKAKSTVIGRAEDCAVRIPLLNVSRRHCELIKGEGELRVRDLASSNGTYVNNKRINELVLNAGDRLCIGPVMFTLQIDGQPEQISPIRSKAEPQAAGADDEIIELEADTSTATAEGSGSTEESDPIAALEAMAAQHTKKQKQ